MKKHPGLRRSTHILNKSVINFKARNSLFPVHSHPTPPSLQALKSSRVRQEMEVHSVIPKDRLWKGGEEGRTGWSLSRVTEEAPLPAILFPTKNTTHLREASTTALPPGRASWANTGLY